VKICDAPKRSSGQHMCQDISDTNTLRYV